MNTPTSPNNSPDYVTLPGSEIREWHDKLEQAQQALEMSAHHTQTLHEEINRLRTEITALTIERDEMCAKVNSAKAGYDALIEAMARFRHQRNVNHYAYISARDMLPRPWRFVYEFLFGKIKSPSGTAKGRTSATYQPTEA